MLAFAAGCIMEAEVQMLSRVSKGVRAPLQKTLRDAYRDRKWNTRGGRIALQIAKPCWGSCFPDFPNLRRTTKKAFVTVV